MQELFYSWKYFHLVLTGAIYKHFCLLIFLIEILFISCYSKLATIKCSDSLGSYYMM